MKLITLDNAPDYDPEQLVAQPFLDGTQLNARVIRLSPGQVLPPHTHGVSELMLYAAEGEGLVPRLEHGQAGVLGELVLGLGHGSRSRRVVHERKVAYQGMPTNCSHGIGPGTPTAVPALSAPEGGIWPFMKRGVRTRIGHAAHARRGYSTLASSTSG